MCCADTVYTVSSATDHYREQTRRAGFGVERAPDYANFTSALPHYPATTFRLKSDDKVPHFIGREFDVQQQKDAQLCKGSLRAAVSGAHRCKHSHRPFLASDTPTVIIKAPRPAPAHTDGVTSAASLAEPTSRTVATQSIFRESDAQTDPYSPDVAPAAAATIKQQLLSAQHHCGDTSELARLADMRFALGNKPGADDVAQVMRLRARRAYEATLPPADNLETLPQRLAMLEQWEQQEWDEREAGLQQRQEERLDKLRQAIFAREAEVEVRCSSGICKWPAVGAGAWLSACLQCEAAICAKMCLYSHAGAAMERLVLMLW